MPHRSVRAGRADGVQAVTAVDPAPCRRMPTRSCPPDRCENLPCARFEDPDETRWPVEPEPPDTADEYEREPFASPWEI